MSGVELYRYLGRKPESGVSKRTAVSERNNLELSGSLLNFLEINDDASVSNEDLGENES
jgi:hypothetical protein